MGTLQIGLLGPIEARLDGRLVPIGGRNERLVLAALTVALNHAVSTDSLIDDIWNDDPPPSGLDTLQSIVSRLRSKLGGDVIELIDHSYRLVADPDQVDAVRFERLLGEASSRLADDPAGAASLATRALALWRGTPFGNLHDAPFLEPDVWRLDALRLSVLETRLEADVACGRLTSAIANLQAEIIENPFRERLWYLLILALARDGRRVDALRSCQQLRAELAEIGLEPSADILELEEMVLEEAPRVRSHLRRSTDAPDANEP
jgi:DNA-binding SARP family transcriptional activator